MIRLFLAIFTAIQMFAQDAPRKLSADELKDAIAKTDNVFLLDVREPKELQQLGSIKGYHNIPVGELEKHLGEIPKDRKILVFCEKGGRASNAAAVLQKQGYDVIGVSGMIEWRDKKYDVVFPDKPPAK